METLNSIIQKMETCIQDNDDLETVMMDCMEEIEENYNQLDSVQPLLRLKGILWQILEVPDQSSILWRDFIKKDMKKNFFCP